jgi:N-acetyl-gamma-glutamyl-phosphate reductase
VLGAHTRAGQAVGLTHPHLYEHRDDVFVDVQTAAGAGGDLLFSCMPSGSLAALGEAVSAPLVIDLSDDFRAAPDWVYGLVEHARDRVGDATRIANPGCYPTATLLGLVPFARSGLIGGPVIVDALSGVSGAGKGLDDSLSFSALHGSSTAYGATMHRHVPEMERGLVSFGGADLTISFTPHLVPMARGLLVTARAPLNGTLDDAGALAVLHEAYSDEPFVTVTDAWPSTKAVQGSNHALVSARVDDRTGLVIVSATIDNLVKGAAGQALQNANVALGLDETLGLEQIAVWP